MLRLWPSDINPGTGTSILIAVAASTYLLLQSEKFLSRASGRRRKSDELSERCDECKSKVEEVKESALLVTCRGCGSLISREKCAEHTNPLDNWRCISCERNSIVRQRTGEWFLKQLRELTDLTPPNAFRERNLVIDPSHAMQIKVRLEKVRELTEQYLAKILNGSLEDTLVGKISNDVEYLYLFHKYHRKLSAFIFNYQKSLLGLPNPTPDANQNDLRRFINRICQEVVNISNSLDYASVAAEQDEKLFSANPRTYEQLVATAVLNKITENYHGNRNLFDIGSDDLHAPTENDEELILQDFDKYQSQVQRRAIPLTSMLDKEISFKDGDDEDGSWEDNWFFKVSQKSADRGLSMVVPTPAGEIFKPLIGDKNVDEIEDSDNESSSSFSNFEYENIIGSDDARQEVSMTSISKPMLIELPAMEVEEKAPKTNKNEIDKSHAVDKLDKEMSLIADASAVIRGSDEALFTSEVDDEKVDEKFEELFKGSIAEREKTKWLKAAPIANNPYSSEALSQRLTTLRLKSSLLDVSSENLTPTPPVESDDDDSREPFQLKEDIRKYKRDYYINSDAHTPPTTPTTTTSNGVHEAPTTPTIKTNQGERPLSIDVSSLLQSPQILMRPVAAESPLSTSVFAETEASEAELFSSLTLSSDDDSRAIVTRPLVLGGGNGAGRESPIDAIQCESYEEKQVIEPEVVEFLPSVKKLAKLYSYEDDFDESAEPGMHAVTKSASESRVYRQQLSQQSAVRPVASITARSLPTKVRTELRKSLTQSDIPIVSYSERNESPDIESGVTRKSIAYFEKLYT